MKDLKMLYAEDSNGDLIYINDAVKDEEYLCPECHQALSVVISKLQPEERYYKKPYFKHRKKSNCSPETILHNLFKRRIVKYIQNKIDNQDVINFSWECQICSDKHQGNLLKKVCFIEQESNLEMCRPDITLLDKNKKNIAVIEIIVTHKPEEQVLQYYKDNKIILIQIELNSFEDVHNYEQRLSNPDIVDLCTNPKCPSCGNPKFRYDMTIVETDCYKCHGKMKVAFIDCHDELIYPSNFTPNEIKIASDNGVLLEVRHSKTMNESYLANVCPHCKAFVGNHFLFDDFVIACSYNDIEYTTVNAGYSCECER